MVILEYKKILGILYILLGVFFIAFPLVSAETVSLMAGICLIAFGCTSIFNGCLSWVISAYMSLLEIVLGFLLILFGFLFFVNLAALSFLFAYSFYFIGFIMICIGIAGIVAQDSAISKVSSVLILIFGVIMLFLAAFSITNPLYVAILIGISLVLRGIILFTAKDVIEEVEGN